MIDRYLLKKYKISFNKFGYDDYSFWLKVLKKTKYSFLIDEYLTIYNTNYNLVSKNKLLALKWIWRIYYRKIILMYLKALFFVSQIFF